MSSNSITSALSLSLFRSSTSLTNALSLSNPLQWHRQRRWHPLLSTLRGLRGICDALHATRPFPRLLYQNGCAGDSFIYAKLAAGPASCPQVQHHSPGRQA